MKTLDVVSRARVKVAARLQEAVRTEGGWKEGNSGDPGDVFTLAVARAGSGSGRRAPPRPGQGPPSSTRCTNERTHPCC